MIDLGPGPDARQGIDAALEAAGFTPVSGDGIEQALSGRDVERDAVELASAIAAAQRAFGELRCAEVIPVAERAIGIAAARQAAGRPVPELARAWTYLLLCADRDNQLDAAFTAAQRLRVLGGSPDVPAGVWAKYPAIDAMTDVEFVELDITTDAPGAAIWIDFQPAGVSPLRIVVPAGSHVIAAAAGAKRGWAAGTAVRTQKAVHIALAEHPGAWHELARRVASWAGKPPAPAELAALLAQVDARIAVIRRADRVEAWGQVGRSDLPRRIREPASTDPPGRGPRPARAAVEDLAPLLGAVRDQIERWDDRAPDPDLPLLTEASAPRIGRTDGGDRPTKWWVYAAIAGAAALGATIIYVHDASSERQRVELRHP